MTLTQIIVTEFIEHYLHKSNEPDGATRRRKRNGENDYAKQVRCTEIERKQSQEILPSLIKVADEFDKFIGDSSKREERFAELTKPLVPLLLGHGHKNQQRYTDAFEAVADELFSQGITWGRIVTFLVYNSELAVEVTKQAKSNEKISTMVSQIIENICPYFEEKIMQWINQQDNGWLSITTYENEIKLDSNNSPNSSHSTDENGKGVCIRQVISVAALAAITGGLYMFLFNKQNWK